MASSTFKMARKQQNTGWPAIIFSPSPSTIAVTFMPCRSSNWGARYVRREADKPCGAGNFVINCNDLMRRSITFAACLATYSPGYRVNFAGLDSALGPCQHDTPTELAINPQVMAFVRPTWPNCTTLNFTYKTISL